MKKIIQFCTIIILVLSAFVADGQNSQILKADAEFQLKNYAKAAELYQKILNSEKSKVETGPMVKKMGECYKKMNQYEAAIELFENYLAQNPNAANDVKYDYADLLLKNGKIDKARKIFSQLATDNPSDVEYARMLACCNFAATEMKKSNKPPIKNQELVNSEQSEFGLGFFNDKLIFASQRLSDGFTSIHGRTDQGFSDLYSASFDPSYNMYNNPERLPGKINTQYNEGTFTFSNKLNTAFFTQCKRNPDLCRILTAKYEKNKWTEIKVLSLGEDEYNFAHPSLSTDGPTLYFASDLPGGFGGQDIWKTTLTPEGTFSVPVNLGSTINTSNNEMFPSIVGDSILLFASEGHIGMGGLDIFYSKIKSGLFERPVNAGSPVNSTSDDFSIVINPDLNGGYFCSNRENNEKSDDIFAFFHNLFLKNTQGKVLDSLTFAPIADVKISYFTNEMVEQVVYTDSFGKFSIPYSAHAICEKKHSLTFEKENYLAKKMNVPCYSSDETLIFLDDGSGRYHTLSGKISNRNSGLPVEGAIITIKSLKEFNDSTYSNSMGVYTFEKVPADDYIVLRAGKKDFLNDSKALATPEGTKTVAISKISGYDTNFELVPIEYEVEFDIENIYYEYDKAVILPESKVSLDKLVNLLAENRDIKIQINSHTDSRGRDAYNMNLSERRSASVVEYLVAAGISESNLISRGFGESRLEVVNAKTEEEHQKNRRTAFEIVGKVLVPPTSSGTTYTFPVVKSYKEKGTDVPGDDLLPSDTSDSLSSAAIMYRLQIIAIAKELNVKSEFSALNDLIDKHGLTVLQVGGLNKYQLGNFVNKEKAIELKNVLEKRGYKDCFVVEVKK